jgi:hypothetical protein
MIYDSSFYHFITVACQLCEATQKPSYVRKFGVRTLLSNHTFPLEGIFHVHQVAKEAYARNIVVEVTHQPNNCCKDFNLENKDLCPMVGG